MKRSKKGSTLVELCVVLAVSAVIITMVASFSSLVYYRTVVDGSRQNALAELSDVRTEISEWIMKHDKNSYVIKEAAVPEEGSTPPDYVERLRVTYSETDKKVLYFSTSAKALVQNDLAGSEPEQIKSYTNIDGLSFKVIQQDDCRAIVECTVTYHIITGKPQKVTFDFTVNAMQKGEGGYE